MMPYPTLTFFLIMGCFFVVASALLMVWITSHARRLSRQVAGMTFWSALALQQTDAVLTYLFNSYAGEFATVRGSWHLVALGCVGAVALAFWSVFIYIDGSLSGPPRRDPRDRHPR